MRSSSRSETGPLRRSVVAGLVLALLVLGAGAALASTQQRTFTAEAVLVVLPRSNLDEATTAAFYETMSRGQIVGTFAEVADNAVFENQAMDDLGLAAQQREAVTSEVTVVPDTSVILVRVTADAAGTSEQVARGAADRMTTYLTGLSDAYRIQVVHQADGSAVPSGMSPALVLLLAALVAGVLGLAVQQAVYHLMLSRRPPAMADAPAATGSHEQDGAVREHRPDVTAPVTGTPALVSPRVEQPTSAGSR